MPLHLSPCTTADIPRYFEIYSASFSTNHPFCNALYPHHTTPSGRALGTQATLDDFHAASLDDHKVYLKVTETETGEMIAAAKWVVYDGAPQTEEGFEMRATWLQSEERVFAEEMFRNWVLPRKGVVLETGGNVLCLDVLVVHPDHQRRGAGRLLTRWGTQKADELGVTCTVEGTDEALALYRSEGFEVLQRYVVPLPEKWKDRKTQEYIWMRRPARAEGKLER